MNSPTKRKIQFNIAAILTITAIVATTFALLRYFNPYLLLPVLAIPIAFAVELLTTGFGTPESIPRLLRAGRLAVVALFALLLAGLSFWSISGGSPTVARPLPFLAFILAMFGYPMIVIVGLPAVAFVVTVMPSVWLQREGLPIRFHLLLIAGTLATIYWLFSGWSYAIGYQSHEYAVGVTAVNLLAVGTLWIVAFLSRNSRSFSQTLGFACALFAWLFASAFPWMGELP